MFGSELVPILLFLIVLIYIPRSPRWLAQRNCNNEALAILTRVNGADLVVKAGEERCGSPVFSCCSTAFRSSSSLFRFNTLFMSMPIEYSKTSCSHIQ